MEILWAILAFCDLEASVTTQVLEADQRSTGSHKDRLSSIKPHEDSGAPTRLPDWEESDLPRQFYYSVVTKLPCKSYNSRHYSRSQLYLLYSSHLNIKDAVVVWKLKTDRKPELRSIREKFHRIPPPAALVE